MHGYELIIIRNKQLYFRGFFILSIVILVVAVVIVVVLVVVCGYQTLCDIISMHVRWVQCRNVNHKIITQHLNQFFILGSVNCCFVTTL